MPQPYSNQLELSPPLFTPTNYYLLCGTTGGNGQWQFAQTLSPSHSLLNVIYDAIHVFRPHDVDDLVEVLLVERLTGVLHDGVQHLLVDRESVMTAVL